MCFVKKNTYIHTYMYIYLIFIHFDALFMYKLGNRRWWIERTFQFCSSFLCITMCTASNLTKQDILCRLLRVDRLLQTEKEGLVVCIFIYPWKFCRSHTMKSIFVHFNLLLACLTLFFVSTLVQRPPWTFWLLEHSIPIPYASISVVHH